MKKRLKKIIKNGFIGRFKNGTFNFAVIYIIHKMLVLLENHLNYLKVSIFECFLSSIIDLFFFKVTFFATHNDGNFKLFKRKNN